MTDTERKKTPTEKPPSIPMTQRTITDPKELLQLHGMDYRRNTLPKSKSKDCDQP